MEEDLVIMHKFDDADAALDDPSAMKERRNAARLQAIHEAYRKMEKKKRFYHIDVEGLMRRQQALLDNLKSDNFALQEMVDTYVIKDYRNQMKHLMDEANRYTGLIEVETKRVHDLEARIRELNSQELDSKKKMGGCMAGWAKHRTTQIHIQQCENRLQKARIDQNIVEARVKALKNKMSQLQEEHDFYSTVYEKLNCELDEWEEDIQQCLTNMTGMYADRNEYHNEITDLMEMDDYKDIYSEWLSMEGWATQEPYSVKYLESNQLVSSETENIEDEGKKIEMEASRKAMNKLRKSRFVNVRQITKTHYAKRNKAGDHYRIWVDIKAFANVQDLLNIDSISDVLPSIIEAQSKNGELFKQMQELVKEMDALDSANQDCIFEKPTLSDIDDSKIGNNGSSKCATNEMVDHIVDSVRHLEIDDEAFLPIFSDTKKQILVIFKEAGCYIEDDEPPVQSQALELTVGKLFSRLEDFVDQISGTFG